MVLMGDHVKVSMAGASYPRCLNAPQAAQNRRSSEICRAQRIGSDFRQSPQQIFELISDFKVNSAIHQKKDHVFSDGPYVFSCGDAPALRRGPTVSVRISATVGS